MSEQQKVRCCDCGFLSGTHSGSYEMVEVPKEFRDGSELARFAPVPICPMGVVNFRECGGEYTNHKLIVDEMRKERVCEEFTKWIPGMSPKEMIHMNIMERQRHWQKEMADKAEQRENERDEREMQRTIEESKIRKWEVFWMSLIVLAVSSLVQIVAAYISKGK